MAEQRPPSFEDLEPEGEPFDESGDPARAQEFGDDGFARFTMGPLGDYDLEDGDQFADFEEFEAPDEFEALGDDDFFDDDEFYDEGLFQPPRDTLATRAARTALRWGSRARGASPLKGKSRRLEASNVAGLSTETCSAAVGEAHELMAALASAAAATEDETEAMGLAAAMVPVAVSLAPNAYRALWPLIPALVRGVMGVTGLLHSRPAARPRIKTLPKTLYRTMAQLARRARRGHAVSGRSAARVLARETEAALSAGHDPGARARRTRRSKPRLRDLY